MELCGMFKTALGETNGKSAHRLGQWMEAVTDRRTVLVNAGGILPVPLRYRLCYEGWVETYFLG